MNEEQLDALYRYITWAEKIRTMKVRRYDFMISNAERLMEKAANELSLSGINPPVDGDRLYEHCLDMLLKIYKNVEEYKFNMTAEFERPLFFVDVVTGAKEDYEVHQHACFSIEQRDKIVKESESADCSVFVYERGSDEYEDEFVIYCESLIPSAMPGANGKSIADEATGFRE